MKEIELKRFLDDMTWDYSKEEIEQIMESELQKKPEDIDMELVDTCMNYLIECSEQKTPDIKDNSAVSKKRIKLSRILVAAVIVVLCLSIGITAYAKIDFASLSDKFVQMFSDHATIEYSNKDITEQTTSVEESKLYKELEDGGIKNIVLPAEFYSAPYENVSWTNDSALTEVEFIVELNDLKVVTRITTFTDEKWIANSDIRGGFTASKQLEVNGMDVYLFERDGNNSKEINTTISYQVGLTQYDIYCNCDIGQAEQFVKGMN